MRAIWICAIGFLTNVTSGIISPTLPLYLQGMQAPIVLISTIVALYGLAKTIGLLYLGHRSDRIGRNNVMILELSSFAAFSVLLALAHQPLLVLALAIPYGLAGNMPTIASASIGDIANKRNINLLMSGFMISIGLGFSLGNFLGGYIVANWGFGTTYYVMGATTVLTLLIVIFALRDGKKHQALSTDATSLFKRMRLTIRDRKIASVCVIAVIVNLGYGLNLTFFPLRASQLGLNVADIGLILAVRGLLSTAVRLPAAILARSIARHQILMFTPVLSALAAGLISLVTSMNAFLILVPIEGMAQGIFLTLGRAEVADSVSALDIGIGLSVLDTFSFSGQTLSVFALGVVAALLGLSATFAVGALVIVVGLALAYYVRSLDVVTTVASQPRT